MHPKLAVKEKLQAAAELLRKKFAAMMMRFITRQNPDDAFFPNAAPQEATDAGGVAGSGEQGVAVAQLEAGTMTELEPGEDVKFSDPADVGGNYEAFERIQLLRIAAGLGLPYDMLTGDLSKTSYSSIRAAEITSYRRPFTWRSQDPLRSTRKRVLGSPEYWAERKGASANSFARIDMITIRILNLAIQYPR